MWGASRSEVAGQTLSQLAANGDAYVVADNAALPFADGSVSTVYTNSVAIDGTSFTGYANVQSSESFRILASGGQWINNGIPYFQMLP